MATRKTFDENAHHEASSGPAAPARPQHNCHANGCPMVGAINGYCTYHWQAHTHDWGRITGVVCGMKPVVDEILRARRTMSSLHSDPVECVKGHLAAGQRLTGYLQPAQADYIAAEAPKDYHAWAYHMEMLLGAEVQKVIKKRRDERNVEHPAYAHRVQAARIPGQAADFLDQQEYEG